MGVDAVKYVKTLNAHIIRVRKLKIFASKPSLIPFLYSRDTVAHPIPGTMIVSSDKISVVAIF